MNCSRFETVLTDYLEQRLEAPVHRAAAVHLQDCPSCRAVLAGVGALRKELATFPEVRPPADLVAGILARTTGRPGGDSFWKGVVLPQLQPFLTRRFSFATVLLFVCLSLMVNVAGPPARAVLSPGGLAESADRVTTQIAMKWAQVLNFADSVVAEVRYLQEDLYGRLDYHLISQLFKSYQRSLEEQQQEPVESDRSEDARFERLEGER